MAMLEIILALHFDKPRGGAAEGIGAIAVRIEQGRRGFRRAISFTF